VPNHPCEIEGLGPLLQPILGVSSLNLGPITKVHRPFFLVDVICRFPHLTRRK